MIASVGDERLPARFWSKVERTDDCWLWLGALNNKGYGSMGAVGVHRLSYEAFVGPIPLALVIDHLCRVRHCVNPAHLEAVTNAENLRRSPIIGLNNGNALKTECPQGHPYDEVNTYRSATGRRSCRPCNNRAAAEYKRRRLDAMIAVTEPTAVKAS